MVKVNGENMSVEGCTIESIVTKLGYNTRRVTIEHNGLIIPLEEYQGIVLKTGDIVEIVPYGCCGV